MDTREYYVYIMTNPVHTVLYTGMTSDLVQRVHQHRSKTVESFTKRYNIVQLVYYETWATAYDAITREKQIKAGSRQKKIDLVYRMNPGWVDLYDSLT